jgi:hypothetical protein
MPGQRRKPGAHTPPPADFDAYRREAAVLRKKAQIEAGQKVIGVMRPVLIAITVLLVVLAIVPFLRRLAETAIASSKSASSIN